ncbi:hypothetical protein DdX_08725 [Ditylenchus destructor]|uniref:Uncharacterized protein n=1 Tax=Ditylenchus destructor TaxID=166010 RepID=A0AAD4R6T2_9BILA|nr:hypothetical protein DdX_08725 [Ditylenchus destructor]
METQTISGRGVKRRRDNTSPDQNQLKKVNLRKEVNFPDDTWLETLKFLACPQWSKMCFVCRKMNGVAQRNISRLPRVFVDSASMYYTDYYARPKEWKKVPVTRYTVVVAFDEVMQGKQSTEWFKNRGFTLDVPEHIPPENALIGGRKWKGYGRGNEWRGNVNVCIHRSAQETIPLSNTELRFPWLYNLASKIDQFKSVVYYAQFNPILNQYSWDYLAQFFKFMYHPSSYIKEARLFAIHQNFVDHLKCTADSFYKEPRHIRCESFVLEGKIGTNITDASDSLKWLAQNVHAETIYIHDTSSCDVFHLLANFLLEASGAKQCASTKMEILVSDPVVFLNVLIQKFRTIPLVESAIPTISFFYPSQEEHRAHLGPNLISQEVDSQGSSALYLISNGQNRMRISFHSSKWCFVSNVGIYSI